MYKILIINELKDYKKTAISHFSISKGFYFGEGLKNNGHDVYFLTTGSTEDDNIKFINIEHANSNFLEKMDVIIIVREAEIPTLFETFTQLKEYLFKKDRKTKIGVKSDSVTWMIQKPFREYVSKTFNIKKIKGVVVRWVNDTFDFVCVQNKEMYNLGVAEGVKNMIISNMSIPDEMIPEIKDNALNKLEFVNETSKLTYNKSIKPNNYTEKIRKNLIYTGRIKVDQGRIIYTMKEIMDLLGNDYLLHIFPGSFYINDGVTMKECSSKNGNHLFELNQFINHPNIVVHYPYEQKDRFKFLNVADCGIDFASSRPENIKSSAGHAKVLEYCAAGLPIVIEKNINNSFLVENAGNGILLENIATPKEYVDAIKKLLNTKIDRKKAAEITIKNENWNVRTKKFIEDLFN